MIARGDSKKTRGNGYSPNESTITLAGQRRLLLVTRQTHPPTNTHPHPHPHPHPHMHAPGWDHERIQKNQDELLNDRQSVCPVIQSVERVAAVSLAHGANKWNRANQ
jgi:hypothetical protein